MKILVSVRSVEEALLAASGGVDFIDLKEPRGGALGGLPTATIRAIVAALRERGWRLPVSATIGDVPMSDASRIAACIDAVGACGVDYVKVGIERVPQAMAVLDRLAGSGWPIVPVFIADHGLEAAHVAHACTLSFPGLMADTADKHAGSLFDVMGEADLQHFVATVQGAEKLVGLAGALRLEHQPLLAALKPDFAGFRTAVCVAGRESALDPQRLQALAAMLHGRAVAGAG